MTLNRENAFRAADRPDIALITNHGYPSVDFPIGGAPDTGGQIVYVNALARALDTLGYRVTIFARGGFPYFESDRIREETEYLSDHARYVFVPGGDDTFLRKEDIATALDEEVGWLDAFIRREAEAKGCRPWELYELVNTHYWDAAVMGVGLVERWRDDVAANYIVEYATGVVPAEVLAAMHRDRHWHAVGEAPSHHLGALMLDSAGTPSAPLMDRVRDVARRVVETSEIEAAIVEEQVIRPVDNALERGRERMAPPLLNVLASELLGEQVFALFHERTRRLHRELRGIDRHVWTPHSLAALKQENFKDRSTEVVRDLKFCERRNHERIVSQRTPLLVATSTEIAERLRTHNGVSPERVFYFPPCVDRSEFRPRTAEELAPTYDYLSEVSGIPAETLKRSRVVFETSRVDQTKRKDLILEAFAKLTPEIPDVYLFIGGGPDNDLLRALVAQRDGNPALGGRAFLTGFIPDEHIGPLFALATVYVSASEMEGFGMSALQAAASGAALVSSDLTPFAVQYVPDDAVVVQAGDVDGFAAALGGLLRDEDDRVTRVGRLAEKTRELDWEAQAQKFLDHLRALGFAVAKPKA